jgi:hypothetical protein
MSPTRTPGIEPALGLDHKSEVSAERAAASWSAAPALLCLVLLAPPISGLQRGGALVEGTERAVLQLPRGVEVRAYSNEGYRLTVEEGSARVEVSLVPIGRSLPFQSLGQLGEVDQAASAPERGRKIAAPVVALARSLTRTSTTRYQASSAVLSWIARNVTYELDRAASQNAADVLERRTAYCTGIAALAVEMHRAAGIPAREVPGLVYDEVTPGYHRWIEVELAINTWVFSDPLRFHHYVPAHYVPLASEKTDNPDPRVHELDQAREGALLATDLYEFGPPQVAARRETARRRYGAVVLRSAAPGTPESETREVRAVLVGPRWTRHRLLESSGAAFLGLEPGSYQAWLEVVEAAGSGHTSATWQALGRPTSIQLRGAELVRLQPQAD